MSIKYITVPAIIRAWVSMVLIYFIRAWSKERQLSTPKEILTYIVAFVSAYVMDTFIWPSRVEMGREESDLVQEYIRYRKEGETMGQYLMRLEKEEEESIKLHEEMLFGKRNKQSQKHWRNG